MTLLKIKHTTQCPTEYNLIGTGCYKIFNGSNMTWPAAREICSTDLANSTTYNNSSNYTTHLLALENSMEKTSLLYWLKGRL